MFQQTFFRTKNTKENLHCKYVTPSTTTTTTTTSTIATKALFNFPIKFYFKQNNLLNFNITGNDPCRKMENIIHLFTSNTVSHTFNRVIYSYWQEERSHLELIWKFKSHNLLCLEFIISQFGRSWVRIPTATYLFRHENGFKAVSFRSKNSPSLGLSLKYYIK